MQKLSKEQKVEIKAMKEMAKEITSSKRKAEKYLQESGIFAFVEEASKAAQNGMYPESSRK